MTKREGVDDKELEFERIALVHLYTIYNAALSLTGHTSDAEDLVQETFLKAYGFFIGIGKTATVRRGYLES